MEKKKNIKIWEKMGNLVPVADAIENYGDPQPTARNMKPTVWVPGGVVYSRRSCASTVLRQETVMPSSI